MSVIGKQKVLLHILILSLLTGGVYTFQSCKTKGSNPHPNGGNSYSLPQLPSMITDEQGAKEYLMLNYWDNFDFADTSLIGKDSTEIFFSRYISLLDGSEAAQNGLDSFLKKITSSVGNQYYYISLFQKYFDHPNSPVRDESRYIEVLQRFLLQKGVDSLLYARCSGDLQIALKNRPGDMAEDIPLLIKGQGRDKKSSLYNVDGEYLLLYFNNPDCYECARTTAFLTDGIGELLDSVGVKILSVYTGEDAQLWRQTIYPNSWICGYDYTRAVDNLGVYHLKAIPTIYLLDSSKRVILKDCTPDRLFEFLSGYEDRTPNKKG